MTDLEDMVNRDALIACADLVDRAGGREFEIGHIRDDVPADQAGWYAHATYQGARIMVDEQPSPAAAALGLATRILTGGQCKCGRTVTLTEDRPDRCRWRLEGDRWESGCDAYGVDLPESMRGNHAAMSAALAAAAPPMNRADRRRQARQGRRRPGRG